MKKMVCLILASLTLLSAAAGCIKKKDPTADNPPKVPQSALATADSAATNDEATGVPPATTVTGEKVQVTDNDLGEIWVTDRTDVPQNSLSDEGFSSDGVFTTYTENGTVTSQTGIDVSNNSGAIDWQTVKAAGVEFVMVRLGGRGYGEAGTIYADDKAAQYMRDAKAAGLKVGGYFFSQATNRLEAESEAKFIKEQLGDLQPDFPIAFDWEIIETEDARTDNIDGAQLTACARAFCDAIKGYGYQPMIYAATRELYFKYDLSQLKDVELWLKQYAETPTFRYQFAMWQYGENVQMEGVEGAVDLNLFFPAAAKP